jgi:hypothetical protein
MDRVTQLLPYPVLAGPGASRHETSLRPPTFFPRRLNKVPSIATVTGCPAGTSSAVTSLAGCR